MQKFSSSTAHKHSTRESLDYDCCILPPPIALFENLLEEEIYPPPSLYGQKYLHVRFFVTLFLFFCLDGCSLKLQLLQLLLLSPGLPHLSLLFFSLDFFNRASLLHYLEPLFLLLAQQLALRLGGERVVLVHTRHRIGRRKTGISSAPGLKGCRTARAERRVLSSRSSTVESGWTKRREFHVLIQLLLQKNS